MKIFAVAIISILCVGCTTTRERAIRIATREIAARKLPLPGAHTVDVGEGYCAVEVGQSYKLWIVDFRVANRKDPLYSVWIDQRFGVIDEFKDHRREQTRSSHL